MKPKKYYLASRLHKWDDWEAQIGPMRAPLVFGEEMGVGFMVVYDDRDKLIENEPPGTKIRELHEFQKEEK